MIVNCSEVQAVALADRIRLATRKPLTLDDGRVIEVSTSIGIAIAVPLSGPICIDAILHSADAMLYRAKDAGRDRAEVSVMSPARAPVNKLAPSDTI